MPIEWLGAPLRFGMKRQQVGCSLHPTRLRYTYFGYFT